MGLEAKYLKTSSRYPAILWLGCLVVEGFDVFVVVVLLLMLLRLVAAGKPEKKKRTHRVYLTVE